MADLHQTSACAIICGAWGELDDEQQVEMLCELYNSMSYGQKDEFLRETGNP